MATRVRVRGHYRKDGTWVPSHYRTSPDKNCRNNYLYPGNYNPNTMKFSPGDPWKYEEQCRKTKRSNLAFKPFKPFKGLKPLKSFKW